MIQFIISLINKKNLNEARRVWEESGGDIVLREDGKYYYTGTAKEVTFTPD